MNRQRSIGSLAVLTKPLRQHTPATLVVGTLLIISALFMAPIVWLFITSLKSYSELGTFPILWWPSQPQWGNFIKALTMVDYGRFAINSLIISVIYSSLVTLSSALVGFGFARLQGKGKRLFFLIMLATIMLPPILGFIPTYVIYAQLGLLNTYWPWVFSGLASSPFLSFLFRQFFSSIPQELEDAAIVDGAGYAQIFWRIFLPLSGPVLATSAIFSFTFAWGDYLTPLLYLNADNTTLSVAMTLGYEDPQQHVFTNILSAGVIFYILPVLILFLFAQRYFIRGIVATGLKG